MSDYQEVSFLTINGSGADELFDKELEKVIHNILDSDTDPQAERSVTLTMKIKPSKEGRDKVVYQIEVNSKLAKSIGDMRIAYPAKRGSRYVAQEQTAVQNDLPFSHLNVANLHDS